GSPRHRTPEAATRSGVGARSLSADRHRAARRLYAPADDPTRADAHDLGVVARAEALPAGVEHVGPAPDLDAPRPPWRNGSEVIDDEGDAGIRFDVREFPAAREVV